MNMHLDLSRPFCSKPDSTVSKCGTTPGSCALIQTDRREQAQQRKSEVVRSDALGMVDRSQPPSPGKMLELLHQVQERERRAVQRRHGSVHCFELGGASWEGTSVIE